MSRPLKSRKLSQNFVKSVTVKPEGSASALVSTSEKTVPRAADCRAAAIFDIHPVDSIREFNSFLARSKTRYQLNEETIRLAESNTQDLLHKMEIEKDANAVDGYKLYRTLRDIRRERRRAKDENALLKPVIDYLSANDGLSSWLGQV